MIKKLFFTLFIFLCLNSKSICNEFIGVIGVAVGDIKNQKNEKLFNGSKIFYGDTIFVMKILTVKIYKIVKIMKLWIYIIYKKKILIKY